MLQFKDLNGLHSCKILKNTDTTCTVLVDFWSDCGVIKAEKVLSIKRNKGTLFLGGVCIL